MQVVVSFRSEDPQARVNMRTSPRLEQHSGVAGCVGEQETIGVPTSFLQLSRSLRFAFSPVQEVRNSRRVSEERTRNLYEKDLLCFTLRQPCSPLRCVQST
jgi:hypothetical protein